ncbi:MAG TPA: PQQ-dependent sugar dehydrogenase [Polyangiales bacterium]|nr:PQQ-dependent sugar dehydrogenase [Polyangiales bacterium]
MMRPLQIALFAAFSGAGLSACGSSKDIQKQEASEMSDKAKRDAGTKRADTKTESTTKAAAGNAAPRKEMMTRESACKMPERSTQPGNKCPGSPPPALQLTEIVSGLVSPTYVLQAPGDDSRFYVLEQRGTVRVVKDGMLLPEPLIDLRDLDGAPVNSSTILPSYGEGGLLGAAFDPRFSETKRMWLSYTKPGPGYNIVQFVLDDPDKLDVTNFKEVLSFQQYGFIPGTQATNHVGSMLAFGPDGCMYVSRGDGGGENDRQMSGQNTKDDLCSILRIDVDKYPEPAAGNLDGHVWSFGFRNPWRYSFDRETGDLYIGDVGQDVGTGFEEINIEPRGESGRNYGWSVAQGSKTCKGDCANMTKPALEYGITDTKNSVIGGYVYRGKKIPALAGRYVWADWTERKVKTLVYKGEKDGQAEICDAYDTEITVPTKVRSFGEGNDGELYIVAGGAPSAGLTSAGLMEAGSLYRIDAADGGGERQDSDADQNDDDANDNDNGTDNDAASGAPTFSAIYAEILTRGATGNCMFGACHGGEPDPAVNGGLQIRANDKAGAYKNLVGAKSTGMICTDKTYVIPGDSKGSLLIQKFSDTPPCGAKMPIGSPLTAAQVDQIAKWIDDGAKDN